MPSWILECSVAIYLLKTSFFSPFKIRVSVILTLSHHCILGVQETLVFTQGAWNVMCRWFDHTWIQFSYKSRRNNGLDFGNPRKRKCILHWRDTWIIGEHRPDPCSQSSRWPQRALFLVVVPTYGILPYWVHLLSVNRLDMMVCDFWVLSMKDIATSILPFVGTLKEILTIMSQRHSSSPIATGEFSHRLGVNYVGGESYCDHHTANKFPEIFARS